MYRHRNPFSLSTLAGSIVALAGLVLAQGGPAHTRSIFGAGAEDQPDSGGRASSPAPATATFLGAASRIGAESAQAQASGPRALDRDAAVDPKVWMIPVHGGPVDAEGGDYGTWAAGPDYKASFHDGFAFYPVLGTAYPHNLPLRWKTVSVTCGKTVLVDAQTAAEKHAAPWRYEYRFGAVTEAYDVRVDGVEQSFVIAERPAGTGDLVVVGRVTTELRADPVQPAHTGIAWKDAAGRTILEYGAAFALDAGGRRTDVRTSYDGENVRLTLDGTWLETARFPVTIDPLTSRTVIATWGAGTYGQPSFPDIARDDETNELMSSYSRASAASDYDTFARITNEDFTGTVMVYSDVTTSWSTRYNQVCFVGGADRWAIALGRDFPTSSGVRVYIHDKNNKTLNSGLTLFLSRPSGYQDQTPSIGGTGGFLAGTKAYLAFRRDLGTGQPNTSDSKVCGVLVDLAGSGSFGTDVRLDSIATTDEEWPCVSKQSLDGDWVVVFQSYNNSLANDDWDAIGRRVSNTGALVGRDFFGSAAAGTHKLVPKVDGALGRFLVSFTEQTNTGKTSSVWGSAICDERATWTGVTASKKTTQTLASSASNSLTTGAGNRGIAYDTNTESHWAVAYHTSAWDVFVDRVGYNGCAVEHRTVYNTSDYGFSPSIVYNDDLQQFAIVFATDESPLSNQPVYGVNFSYPTTASFTTYGVGCAGTVACDNRGLNNDPHAGSEFFEIELSSAIPSRPYALYISTAAASVPLGGGCTLNLGGPLFHIATAPTNASGFLAIPAPLPDCPVFIGNVYAQFFTVVGGMLKSSRGVQIAVR